MGRPRLDPTDILGKQYNSLTVIEYLYYRNDNYYYKAKCSCGNTKVVRRDNLLNGKIKSCGCYRDFIKDKIHLYKDHFITYPISFRN